MSRILQKSVVFRYRTTAKLLAGKISAEQSVQEHMRLNRPCTGDSAQIL